MIRTIYIKMLLIASFFVLNFSVFAVEGKIEISGPTIITSPGSYILVNNIEATTDTAIDIQSSDVKLDLNGFTIRYTGTNTAHGISMGPGYYNIEITNGTIKNFSNNGIYIYGISDSTGIKISNLRISGNLRGICLQYRSGFIIENCIIYNNNYYGIQALGSGLVLNCVISNNTYYGLSGETLGFRSNIIIDNELANILGTPVDLGENIY